MGQPKLWSFCSDVRLWNARDYVDSTQIDSQTHSEKSGQMMIGSSLIRFSKTGLPACNPPYPKHHGE